MPEPAQENITATDIGTPAAENRGDGVLSRQIWNYLKEHGPSTSLAMSMAFQINGSTIGSCLYNMQRRDLVSASATKMQGRRGAPAKLYCAIGEEFVMRPMRPPPAESVALTPRLAKIDLESFTLRELRTLYAHLKPMFDKD